MPGLTLAGPAAVIDCYSETAVCSGTITVAVAVVEIGEVGMGVALLGVDVLV